MVRKKCYVQYSAASLHFFLTANNLYGSSQTKPLPVGDFEWLSEEECATLEAQLIRGEWVDEHAETGYILEVDLHYPEELHEEHNSFPLAPERVVVGGEMLSEYSRRERVKHI